ncbi:hypothetical protein H310_08147 [Aphanomyces invadans]|uniref:Uncharacterized protein n=1 Tax=Aphanomyces invadans TaxID=157072 RepID=A0A024TZP6_9STRA|nr:hypothetical protein H310_08147 [Aphanomyces invadans]ETV99468.1 hypothetical protein H310_08147 [Aphanomyces invadans]|eukprot:XP_008872024.1 hypothetical protein H310_08147 [Aphanomyces invadans]
MVAGNFRRCSVPSGKFVPNQRLCLTCAFGQGFFSHSSVELGVSVRGQRRAMSFIFHAQKLDTFFDVHLAHCGGVFVRRSLAAASVCHREAVQFAELFRVYTRRLNGDFDRSCESRGFQFAGRGIARGKRRKPFVHLRPRDVCLPFNGFLVVLNFFVRGVR